MQGITALLSVIRGKYDTDKELLNQLDLIKSAFISIRNTVRNLIDLNRPGKEKKQLMEVDYVIENTVALIRSYLTKNMVNVQLKLTAGSTKINASPQQIGQVIMNLINNAVDAMVNSPEFQNRLKGSRSFGGEIEIETVRQEEEIVITVKDTGPGISEHDLNRIFDPFFTRKKMMGMGIGLSICHGIIEDHKGTIVATNSKEGGAVLTIKLPL